MVCYVGIYYHPYPYLYLYLYLLHLYFLLSASDLTKRITRWFWLGVLDVGLVDWPGRVLCSMSGVDLLWGGWLLFSFISTLLLSCHLFSYPFISFGYVIFLHFCLFGH